MAKSPNRPRQLAHLGWRDLRHVEKNLGCDRDELAKLLVDVRRHYRFRTVTDAKGKQREICTTYGRLRALQDHLLRCLSRVTVAEPVHGSVPGRSSIGNAMRHANPHGFVKVDIKDCFPSISHRRVYGIFSDRLKCSPDVSRLLTKLVTVNGRLPQGVPTSPFLAALATEPLAKRLNGLAKSRGGRATMYVDDGTLSGPRGVARALKTAESILVQEGFRPHPTKCVAQTRGQLMVVTGVRVDGGIDAPPNFAETTANDLEALKHLASSRSIDNGQYQTQYRKVRGKLNYLAQLNRGVAKPMLAAFADLQQLSPHEDQV